MPTYTFYVYSSSVLAYNGGTAEFDFDADYLHYEDRYRIDVSDDDATMNSGADVDQIATIYDMDGNVVDSGNIYVTQKAEVSDPGGGSVFLDRVAVNGTHYGYLPSADLTPGESYPVTTAGTSEDAHTHYETNSVPCFGAYSLTDTPNGPFPIDKLTVGDKVLTYDNGYQPVVWTGSQRVSQLRARLSPKLRPIRLRGGVRGMDEPQRPLTLSRQHRVLIDDPAAEIMAGERQVLLAALHFATPTLPTADITWHHIMLRQHEIIRANGVWVESLYSGDALSHISTKGQSHQIRAALGEDQHWDTARPCLRGLEARALLAQLRQTPDLQSRNKRVA